MSAQPSDKPPYTVAVRALCEFGLRRGDLDQRLAGGPTAQEGQEGHALVASRRASGYRRELPLQADVGDLRVRGRADGYDPAAHRLEEVKTFRGRLERQPPGVRALHWAQLMVYGALLCREQGCAEVELALVYLDLASGQETAFTRRATAAELERELQSACAAFAQWARLEAAHRAARDAALQSLAFPHAAFRPGQRTLAEAVYRAARDGRCLLAQAPTGIGKTVGTLFPLLKAVPGQGIDRIGFLTAKTSGRALALQALAALREANAGRQAGPAPQAALQSAPTPQPDAESPPPPPFPLRVLELVARDKSCEHPDKQCHGGSCPLAAGFYDRLPAARLEAITQPAWEREPLRALAARHGLCPYYLGLELAPWADVYVGDYNHWFDGAALLHGLSTAQGWKTALLVDEAHNLVDRARRMYSAELDPATWRLLSRGTTGEVKRALQRLQRRWREAVKLPDEDGGDTPPAQSAQAAGAPAQASLLAAESGTAQAQPVPVPAPAPASTPPTRTARAAEPAYRVLEGLPDKFVEALQGAANAVLEAQAEATGAPDAEQLDFAFEALHFARLAAEFGPHALLDLQTEGTRRRLSLRNVVPAPHLAPRLAAAQSLTLFSATLQPPHHHRQLLGLPEDTVELQVPAPFAAEQLRVRVARRLSTRWQHRQASLGRIVALMAAQYDERPGHYLAFFSSYGYLQQAADAFEAARPDIPAWRQSRGMSEPEQAAFIARFVEGGRGLGFAVLGGAFSEGIDLPGERLIGAFVATLGLPQVNPVNEQFRRLLDERFGAGFDHAYLYPGLQKVVQAAGRVIRGPEDRGVLHLLDERFNRPDVRALLPAWWAVGD